jgi:hypothetical protein
MTPLVGFTLRGRGGNLPSVTGARRPVLLGSITPGRLDHSLIATPGTRPGRHTALVQRSISTGAVD